MAFTLQSTTSWAGTPTTSPQTITHTTGAGNLLVLILSRSTATDPFTTVTDSASQTWTRATFAPTAGSTGRRIEMWFVQNSASITSLSVAFTGAGQAFGTLLEYAGGATAGQPDVANSTFQAASTTPTAVTGTPTASTDLWIAAIMANSNTASQCTPSTGTPITVNNSGFAAVWGTNQPSGVAFGVSWTLVTSVGTGSEIGFFKLGTSTPVATIWNGSTELTVTSIAVWDGTTENPATLSSVT